MKILLAAINAKYIHSNPAVHSLRAAARKILGEETPEIVVGEFTINHSTEAVRADIYGHRPDVLAFSCYIWNIAQVRILIRDLHRLLPHTEIWLGGPEVSFHGEQLLRELPEVTGIMRGSGERTFASLAKLWTAGDRGYGSVPGIIFRDSAGELQDTGDGIPMPLSEIPFWYSDLTEFENRIIYYESSRGCPFRCSYCLSSVDKSLCFRDLSQVEEELQFFLDRKVPQVKFIDRTFNCRESYALAIWRFLKEHDNGITNFHFEIAADLLTEEELRVLSSMRPGLVQLEIGVQSTRPETLREIRRTMDLGVLSERVAAIRSFRNIHQHLDLIAGLPYEDYESFGRSFDEVYAMAPDQLQLGFLKVLKGAHMEEMAASYGLIYTSEPPYEVMATRWLPYEDVLRLKAVEEMVEMYYNSGQFASTLSLLIGAIGRPFTFYERLAAFRKERGISGIQSSREAKYKILLEFGLDVLPEGERVLRETLVHDCYLRENMKNRPAFAPKQREEDWEAYKALLQREAADHRLMPHLQGLSYREMMNRLHGEFLTEEIPGVEGSGRRLVIYDYSTRDPLTHNARIRVLSRKDLHL